MKKEIYPKPYSTTDTKETLAIQTFKNKIDLKYVKSFINERDKVPNEDGYIEIVDDNQIPLGRICVQIKAMPKAASKYSCEIELFSYADTITMPFILVCVDIENNKVLWKHIRREMAVGKEDQKSITINFVSPDDEVDNSYLYLSRWSALIKDYQERIKNYLIIKQQLEEVRLSASMHPYSTPLQGMGIKDIENIQAFVDEINRLLDLEYKIVKDKIFKEIWKIGIIIHFYTQEQIAYSLFSIKTGSTDSLIKYIDLPASDIFKDGPYGFLSAWSKNEINKNPKETAKRFALKLFEDLLKNRILSIKNEYLCTENMFEFIDEHSPSTGLEIKDLYHIDELQTALYAYLPRWCIAALGEVSYPKHLKYIDPSIISRMFLRPEKHKEVHEKTIKMIKANTPIQPFIMGGMFMQFNASYEALQYFLDNNVKEIKRIYRQRDPKILRRYIWEGYKKENLDYNVSMLLNNLENTYNEFIRINNLWIDEYSLYKDYDKVLYLYQLKEKYGEGEYPIFKVYYLKLLDGEKDGHLIECYDHQNIDFAISQNNIMELKGKKYKIMALSTRLADNIFKKSPMLNMIYELLNDHINKNK